MWQGLAYIAAILASLSGAFGAGWKLNDMQHSSRVIASENAQLKDALEAASAANESVRKLNESMEALNAIPDSDCPVSPRLRAALDLLRPTP